MNIGTTTEAVARALLKHRNLMVITNNLNVANILATSPNSEVIVAGGILRRADGALVGDVTAEFIGQFKVDYAIIGSAAVDPDGSLLDYDFREVRVAQAIIKNARKSYLVADHTKFKMAAPVRIASPRRARRLLHRRRAAEVDHPALRRQRRLHPHRRERRPRAVTAAATIRPRNMVGLRREDAMAARTGARLLVDCLLAQGVTTAFGVPGESYLAVLDALHDVPDRIRMIPNRQEGGAAFMAAAWGKLTGRPGIAFVTRGPGATNAAIGVHTARQDSSPMILFVGQIGTRHARPRGVPGGRLPRRLRHAGEVGGRDRRRRPGARARRPRLRGGADRPAGAGGGGAARGHADRRDRGGRRPGGADPAGRRRARGRRRDRPPARCRRARRCVLAGGGGWGAAGRAGLRAFAEANRLPVVVGFRDQDLLDNVSPSYAGDAGLAKTPGVRGADARGRPDPRRRPAASARS